MNKIKTVEIGPQLFKKLVEAYNIEEPDGEMEFYIWMEVNLEVMAKEIIEFHKIKENEENNIQSCD